MLEYITDPSIPIYFGYIYMITIFLSGLLGSFIYYYSNLVSSVLGLRVN